MGLRFIAAGSDKFDSGQAPDIRSLKNQFAAGRLLMVNFLWGVGYSVYSENTVAAGDGCNGVGAK